MFSFHKPRVYRSAEGCCICRAKSSSSRFTDSRKYEHDSMKCFDLQYPRHGEICNACVLLVKRFKRLPVGSTRHWGHVVDARAGPGTKSISKHKKNRDDGEHTSNGTPNSATSSRRSQNSKSLIPEKFSKIFKKSKKSKAVVDTDVNSDKKTNMEIHRSSTTIPQTWTDQHLLSTTPDSMDSDYEDAGDGGGGGESRRTNYNNNGSYVQFQTQTRASAYRASRQMISNDNASNSTLSCRKSSLKVGSKRRKCLPPIRNRPTLERFNDKVQFFDESEWQERRFCCGMMKECASLAGTIIIDVAQYQPCAEHQRQQYVEISNEAKVKPAPAVQMLLTREHQPVAAQNTIIATTPTVVQISAPPAIGGVCPPPLPTPVQIMNTNTTTQVLKKHHLFFKRQSECFPQVDLAANISTITSSHKTESLVSSSTTSVITNGSSNNTINNITISTVPHQSTISNGNSSTPIVSTALPLAINATNISALSNICPSSATVVSAQMPRHSTAKITTISPSLTTTATCMNGGNKLLHKLKTGKIFKHSLEKIGISSGVGAISAAAIDRIKAGDLQELKPVVRTVSKSYVLTKPTTTGSNPQCAQYYPVGSSPTSTCSNSLPISSSSSSAAPKFSDNSSDSGFDENLQDRKSASPLQEDTEKKLATRAPIGNVHTMFLASGVQIQGQHQNLMLTGNEIAAKLLQNRKQQMSAMSTAPNATVMHQQYQHQTTNAMRLNATATSLKIAQVTPPSISTLSVGGAGNILGSHIKPTTAPTTATRAIYNNNTIQHENGVTTIVPASSLAASTQTAAMNALAPSTVTITPAPTHLNTVGTAAVSLTKKLATSGVGINLIAAGSNNHSNILHTVATNTTHLINHSNNTLLQQHNQHHNTSTNLNQKIILLKATAPTKYNNLTGIVSSGSGSVANTNTANATGAISAAALNAAVCKN